MKRLIQILVTAGTPAQQNINWGKLPFMLTIIANCLWPIAWLYCNENKISFAQSTLARGICTLALSYIGCQQTPIKDILDYRNNFKLLLVRSIIMTFHSLFTGFAQFILPLPIVHTIACSGTLFVFLIDYLINGTQINMQQGIGMTIGIFGVFMASNGKLITKYFYPEYEYETKYQNYLITDTYLVTLFTFAYCIVVMLWAYGIVITRLAKSNTFQINFILGVVFHFGGCLLLPFMPFLGYESLSFDRMFKTIIFTGFPCFVVQILVITSLTMTKQTGVLNIMSFSMVFVSFMISILRYHQRPNLVCFIGIVMVVIGCAKTVLSMKQNIIQDTKQVK